MIRPKILVTGATGKTGRAVVGELVREGSPVRAIVHRRDARSELLARLGVEIVEADLENSAQLERACNDVQRAYFCPPITPQVDTATDVFLHAVEANRLEAVAVMTQWLASPKHPTLMTRDMWRLEQKFAALKGTAVTILNPGFFADNYLRVSIGMAAQLGLYANFVGDSRNAPPSNDDMARVIAGVLADPGRFAGRRMRITGPETIGVEEITATLAKVLGRKVRAIDAPLWLLNKVAAYRGEPRYAMACFAHYLVDHRQGAFAYGAPTDVVREVTGRTAESFETTVRTYAARPEAQRTGAAFRRALWEFMVAPVWPGYDHAAYERQLGRTRLDHPLYAMEDPDWKADHAQPDGQIAHAVPAPSATVQPLWQPA